MSIEIFPLDKVVIDGVAIYLGMEQAAVEAAIGKGEVIGNRCYYFNSKMAIDSLLYEHQNKKRSCCYRPDTTGQSIVKSVLRSSSFFCKKPF